MQGKWNKETIEALLQRSDGAVERALVVLHNRQTPDEKRALTTTHHNGRGFGAFDARILSSMAGWVKRGNTLTVKQLGFLRKKGKKGFCILAKYHAQLIEEIEAKEAAKIAA